ncbi:GNAT family N-acetyltransferase [Clostridium felsineum]|uniref:GNAT family N-acetyltransferase n=1 Tax=Clostridium felsineum TaxID=36839 RepID=UPI00214DD4EE|nr:GNAT family N-acetyltransferase [Clostridium felsineum]MCR3757566.1 GNAT family N-acetyltransferase [Clostridium felsineum]
MEEFQFVNGGLELLDLVEPLWEKLNKYHENKAKYFAYRYKKFKFDARRKSFTKANIKAVNIDLIKKGDNYIGYCISTINDDKIGEIESIFIEEDYRKFSLGDKLMTRALKWLDENEVKSKRIGVAEGNEKVLEFYKKYGFYKRTIILQKIDEKER